MFTVSVPFPFFNRVFAAWRKHGDNTFEKRQTPFPFSGVTGATAVPRGTSTTNQRQEGSVSLWLAMSGERVSVVRDVWGAGRERVSVARDVWEAWPTWQTDESAKRNGALHGTVITVAIPFLHRS